MRGVWVVAAVIAVTVACAVSCAAAGAGVEANAAALRNVMRRVHRARATAASAAGVTATCPGKCQFKGLACGGAYQKGLCPTQGPEVLCCVPPGYGVVKPPSHGNARTAAPGAAAATSASAVSAPVSMGPASAEYKAYQTALLKWLEHYAGATEGAADGRFRELFGDLTQVRKNNPGFSTCTSFTPIMFQRATRDTHWTIKKQPDANFFNFQTRKSIKLPGGYVFSTLPALNPMKKTLAQWQASDATATYVDLTQPNSPRPQPGDVFLLGFARDHPTSKVLKAGYFSHIGFVTAIKKLSDGRESWTVIAGGGGSVAQRQEMVTKSDMIVDVRSAPVMVGDPSNPIKKYLAAWASVQALHRDGKASK